MIATKHLSTKQYDISSDSRNSLSEPQIKQVEEIFLHAAGPEMLRSDRTRNSCTGRRPHGEVASLEYRWCSTMALGASSKASASYGTRHDDLNAAGMFVNCIIPLARSRTPYESRTGPVALQASGMFQ